MLFVLLHQLSFAKAQSKKIAHTLIHFLPLQIIQRDFNSLQIKWSLGFNPSAKSTVENVCGMKDPSKQQDQQKQACETAMHWQ